MFKAACSFFAQAGSSTFFAAAGAFGTHAFTFTVRGAIGTGVPLKPTTVVGGTGCAVVSLSVLVVLVAVAVAFGAGFLAASPSAVIIFSLLCCKNTRSFSS